MRGVLLSLLAILVLLWGCGGDKKTPNGTDDPETYRVVFITNPAGAVVYFDGDSVGVTTEDPTRPLIVEDVLFGEPHTSKYMKQGYAAIVENNYNPTSTGTQRIELPLKQSATVTITTSPPGAYVVFGTVAEGPSPLILEEVQIGNYEVTVSSPGFMTLTDFLDLSVSLERHFTLFVPPEIVGSLFRATDAAGTDIVTSPDDRFPQILFNTGPDGEDRCKYMELVLTIDKPLPDLAQVVIVVLFEGGEIERPKLSIPVGETELVYRFKYPNNPGMLEPIIHMLKGEYEMHVTIENQIVLLDSFVIY